MCISLDVMSMSTDSYKEQSKSVQVHEEFSSPLHCFSQMIFLQPSIRQLKTDPMSNNRLAMIVGLYDNTIQNLKSAESESTFMW